MPTIHRFEVCQRTPEIEGVEPLVIERREFGPERPYWIALYDLTWPQVEQLIANEHVWYLGAPTGEIDYEEDH